MALSDGVGDTLGDGSGEVECAVLTGRPCATGAAAACALCGGARSAGCAAGERVWSMAWKSCGGPRRVRRGSKISISAMRPSSVRDADSSMFL
eukprot:3801847-Pleurochrysis_carterae.AAC.1